MAELDRVTGGGFVRGSVLLVGGDPGIGKSTLLTQATSLMARAGHRAVYISGEEAVAQVRLRAERLGLADAPVQLAAETSVEDIVSTLSQGPVPRLIVIDSIQTMWTDTVESAPGTVTQVRASAQALIRFAKKSGAAIILVGHVTKDGQIAGPRVVEHMVTRCCRSRARLAAIRILRAVKPLRSHRRNRRVRDDGPGLARSLQSVRAVFVRARSRQSGHGGVRRY
jgi:DNA repair protein RadA/Sms